VRSLTDELICALEDRLGASGWVSYERIARIRPSAFAAGHLATFSRPGHEEFAVTAVFSWRREDESSPLIVAGRIGVEYEPAGPWLAALTDPESHGVLLLQPLAGVAVATAADVEEAVDELVAFVGEASRNSAGVSDLGALIDLLRSGQAVSLTKSAAVDSALDYVEEDEQDDVEAGSGEHEEYPAEAEAKLARAELMAVLLALADHADEARKVLRDYRPPSDEPQLAKRHVRFMRHFERFLLGGSGQAPGTPARWPPAPVRPERPQSVAERIAELAPTIRRQRDATRAVRAVSEGKTRAELRNLLERELDERNVPMDPSAVDTRVDLLATERETFGRARIALKGLKALGDLITRQSARTESQPDEHISTPREPPENETELPEDETELDLPERAAYPIDGSAQRWAAVVLEPDARPCLDNVAKVRSLGHGSHVAAVDVWLSEGSSPSNSEASVTVNIGAHPVGRLRPDDADLFRDAMHAAAERDEDAWTRAWLTASSGAMPYQLEVMLPRVSM
jgi:hypothetical protein